MNELAWWPPVFFLALALLGYAIYWSWGRRLDREDEAHRQRRHPAE